MDTFRRNKFLIIAPVLFTLALLALVAYLSTGQNAFLSHVYTGN